MHCVRVVYARYPRLVPLGINTCLFAFADGVAQYGEKHLSGAPSSGPDVAEKSKQNPGAPPSHCGGSSISSSSSSSEEDPYSSSWDFDYYRLAGVTAWAPFNNIGLMVFYHNLDRICGAEPVLRTAIPKMLGLQLFYMPFSTPMYVFFTQYWAWKFENYFGDLEEFPAGKGEGKSFFDRAWERARTTYFESYGTSFLLWPVSDIFNMTIVARNFGPAFRTTWDAGVSVVWNFFLSAVTFRQTESFGSVFRYLGIIDEE